jgi:hypothetical protein
MDHRPAYSPSTFIHPSLVQPVMVGENKDNAGVAQNQSVEGGEFMDHPTYGNTLYMMPTTSALF